MPVNIPINLPSAKILNDERVFIMTDERAQKQDIRPLKIGILNLMPTKIETETQLLRLLSNTPLQINITLLQMESYVPKNTPKEHLTNFYKTFEQIKNEKFDGLIITGAPVENLTYEDVTYWSELCEIMEWTKTNVFSTFHICWGAMAGLYYHYGIQKHKLDKKLSGVYKHNVKHPSSRLVRGFHGEFFAPHSRHTDILASDLYEKGLKVLSRILFDNGKEESFYIATSRVNDTEYRKNVFVTGHSEYDLYTLDAEYKRDLDKIPDIPMPFNYYKDDDSTKKPVMRWHSHAYLLFANWLNYYVYQETFFDLSNLGK